ncbi:MAG: hypothetical protein ACRD2A_26165, partial [Vicinamibacterales bacterium]
MHLRAVAAFAMALPPIAATLAVVTFSTMELLGRAPLSYEPMRNVAEAAAMGSPSEVLRLVGAGQSLSQEWPVRADIISSEVTRATGLEAAVWSRSAMLMQLLDRRGDIGDAETRHHLTCLANDIRVEEIVTYLSRAAS